MESSLAREMRRRPGGSSHGRDLATTEIGMGEMVWSGTRGERPHRTRGRWWVARGIFRDAVNRGDLRASLAEPSSVRKLYFPPSFHFFRRR
jgi:hypothetical protein